MNRKIKILFIYIKNYLDSLLTFNVLTGVLAVLIIATASFIPIIHTYGRLNIGGDMILPLNPQYSFKNAYEWVQYTNGTYASNDFFQWISVLYILTKLGLSIYQAGFIFQFLIFFLSGLGIYSIFHLWYKQDYLLGIIPAISFIYSPHRYDHMIYFYGTPTIIWLLFFLFRFIQNKRFSIPDLITISILVGFIGNLPNPKYHFLVFVTYGFVILLSVLLRLLTLKDLFRSLPSLFIIVLLTSYLWMPFLYFGYSFAHDPSLQIPTMQGDKQHLQTIDYGIAFLFNMITLWHTPNINKDDVALLRSPVHIFFQYLIPVLTIGLFPLIISSFERTKRKIYWLYGLLALLFVFFAKSSNAPFGWLYLWILGSNKVFAFLRTSAGIVIFAGIFYSLCLGAFFEFIINKTAGWKRYTIGTFLSITILIVGYHVWTGRYFRSFSPINKYLDTTKYGLIVPQEYFSAAQFMAQRSLLTKIDIFPGALGYQNNTWGYFGPIIYPWIFNKPTISIDKTLGDSDPAPYVNTRYALDDKTMDSRVKKSKVEALRRLYFPITHQKIYSSKILDIYQKKDEYYVPLFYTELGDFPRVEYSAVNPTLYRVRIHGAKKPFQLIFTDNYHSEWRLYEGDMVNYPTNLRDSQWKAHYTITPPNQSDQASTKMVEEFLKAHTISVINNPPNFISKEFRGAVQNDNLPGANGVSSLLRREIYYGSNHVNNRGLNLWDLNPTILCKELHCTRQSDGSYSFEVIVEFQPQRLVTIGYGISTLVACILLITLKLKRRIIV